VPKVIIRPAASTAVALALALSGSAAAAQIKTDQTCYLTASKGSVAVSVSATGLDAGQPYTVALGAHRLAAGTTDLTGALTTTVDVPRLGARHDTQTDTLVVTEGANTETTTFGIARVNASFSPTVGSPGSLRVRFSGTGFALVRAKPSVYVHEVDPRGTLVRTFALGRASGPCGTIVDRRRHRLFPQAPRAGTWHLQFDTSRTYHRARASFLYYALAVTVSR
jgi:hypothetical protein